MFSTVFVKPSYFIYHALHINPECESYQHQMQPKMANNMGTGGGYQPYRLSYTCKHCLNTS